MRVLVAGLGEHKEFGLRSLRDQGHLVGVVEEPDRVPVDLCDWWAPADYRDVDSVVAAASRSAEPWDAVVCWEEVAVDVAHEAASRLGVPHPRMPARHFRDKQVMHERVRAAGLASPQLGVATGPSEAAELAGARFPLVVKPADFGGSCGVRVVRDPAGLAEAFRAAAELSFTGRVIVDRYVSGPEFSVEAVTTAPGHTEVVCVVEKHLTAPPYCVETGHRLPAALSTADVEVLAGHARRAVDALGMAAGVSHGEFKLTPDGPVLMEVAGRPAGGHIPRLVALVTGCNLYQAELAAVTGGPQTRTEPVAPSGAIHFFVGDGVTAGHRIGVAETTVPPLDGVLRELRYWASPDTVLPVARDVDDRVGFALLAGELDEVRAALAALANGSAGDR